jgi:predicted nucleotidyltransferase
MEKDDVESLVQTLNQREIQYMIVGGLAVTAHGFVRFTADVDLILLMEQDNLLKAISLFKELGYLPRSPVSMDEYADPQHRRQWAKEKGMVVFSLFSPKHPATDIDLFIEPPLEVEKALSQVKKVEIAPGIVASFCALEDLINMKLKANRPKDQEDIRQLRKIHDHG